MRPAVPPVVIACLALALVASACAGGPSAADTTAAASTAAPSSPSSTVDDPPGEQVPDTGGPTTTTATTATTATLPPEPTGVPGIDDLDEFCSAWARYGGTLQAIGVAAAFGDLSSVELARLELLAAPALVSSVAGIGGSWPAELVSERSAVLGDLVGPHARRAEKALAALTEAGATEADLASLRAAWLDALRTRDPSQPVIDVPGEPAALAPLIDQAAAAFAAAVTPFPDDPSLDTAAVETPLTDAFLADYCPDLASSGVGDAI